MSEEFLDGADVIPGFQEMGRKAYRGVHGPLQDQFVPMVPPDAACARVTRQPGGRKDILPHPLVMGIEVLALERVRKIHVVTAGRAILAVEMLDVQ